MQPFKIRYIKISLNLTKVSPIQVEYGTMITEYLPVSITKLEVKIIWVNRAAWTL